MKSQHWARAPVARGGKTEEDTKIRKQVLLYMHAVVPFNHEISCA